MELTRPWSITLSYVRDRIATYSATIVERTKALKEHAPVTAPAALIGAVIGAASVAVGVLVAPIIGEEAGRIWALASSAASSAEHVFVLDMARLLYYVRCSVVAMQSVFAALTVAVVVALMTCDLLRVLSRSVTWIEAARENIYNIVRDKFGGCVRCAHKVSCDFHSYAKMEVAAQRAMTDLGIDLFRLQDEAELIRNPSYRRYTWDSLSRVFHDPQPAVVAEEPEQSPPAASEPEPAQVPA